METVVVTYNNRVTAYRVFNGAADYIVAQELYSKCLPLAKEYLEGYSKRVQELRARGKLEGERLFDRSLSRYNNATWFQKFLGRVERLSLDYCIDRETNKLMQELWAEDGDDEDEVSIDAPRPPSEIAEIADGHCVLLSGLHKNLERFSTNPELFSHRIPNKEFIQLYDLAYASKKYLDF